MINNPSCQHHRIDNDTWQCERCGNSGAIFTRDDVIWECGKAHHGAPVPV